MSDTISNAELLSKLDTAIKAVTVTDLGEAILQPQKFDRFVRSMQARTIILPEARFIRMESQITDIDRIGFVGRILTQAIKSGETVVGTETQVAPIVATAKLTATELRASTGLSDRALRRNIERGDFENTLVDLFGEAAGRDFEEWAVLADTANTADDLLGVTNGWAKLAGKKLYGKDGTHQNANFDPTKPEDIFEKLLLVMDKQFLVNRSEWRFYVPFAVENGYRNALKARGTALGDQAMLTNMPLTYKGIPVVYAPMLERSEVVDTGEDFSEGSGNIVMLQHPDNVVWGIFYQVNIERERKASERQTNFYLTIEADSGYENPNAAAVAFIDIKNPNPA